MQKLNTYILKILLLTSCYILTAIDSVAVDPETQSITIINAQTNDKYFLAQEITLDANLTFPTNETPPTISRVEFFANQKYLGKGSKVDNLSWRYDWFLDELGVYDLSARFIDTDGNTYLAPLIESSTNYRINIIWKPIYINFQEDDINQTPSYNDPNTVYYIADTGLEYSKKSENYIFGWDQNISSNTFYINDALGTPVTLDQKRRRSGIITHDKNGNHAWKIRLPNGRYSITLVVGKYNYKHKKYNILLNGSSFLKSLPIEDQTVYESWQITEDKIVVITDGYLHITDESNGHESPFAYIKINCEGVLSNKNKIYLGEIDKPLQQASIHILDDIEVIENSWVYYDTDRNLDPEDISSQGAHNQYYWSLEEDTNEEPNDWWKIPIYDTHYLLDAGEFYGGYPLYTNTPYRFIIGAGKILNPSENSLFDKIRGLDIDVYSVTTNAIVGHINIPLPKSLSTSILSEGSKSGQQWKDVSSAGGVISNINTEFGLHTRIEILNAADSPESLGRLPWVLSLKADNNNYTYRIVGKFQIYNSHSTVDDDVNSIVDKSDPLDFSWKTVDLMRVSFTEQSSGQWITRTIKPEFEKQPMPSHYYGKSIEEILNSSTIPIAAPIEPDLSGNNITADDYYKRIDDSPELRSHSILNKLVDDYNKDPLALANFVQNEIELTDPVDYQAASKSEIASIGSAGVKRAAIGTYLEGQGSPWEQCALLIYLLRQSDYQAAYAVVDNDKLLMLTSQVSRLLGVQIDEEEYASEFVAVNYPWVVVKIGGVWKHIFPWIKDHEISEGFDLYSMLPENYDTPLEFVLDFLREDPDILPKVKIKVETIQQGDTNQGLNEKQKLTFVNFYSDDDPLTPKTGKFWLTFEGEQTKGILHNASPSQVKEKLRELSNLSENEILVSRIAIPNNNNETYETGYEIEFTDSKASTDVQEITVYAPSLYAVESDQPSHIWPNFIEDQLQKNYPNLTLNDIGTWTQPRKKYYARWEDFPKPASIGGSPKIIGQLTGLENNNVVVDPGKEKVLSTIQIKFSYKVDSSVEDEDKIPIPELDTGEIYYADLHNRKLFVYWEPQTDSSWDLKFHMGPYDRSDTNLPNNPSTWPLTISNVRKSHEDKFSTATGSEVHDDEFFIETISNHYRSLDGLSALPLGKDVFLNIITARDELDETNLLATKNDHRFVLGEQGALVLATGRVTQKMLDVHYKELREHQNDDPVDPTILFGTNYFIAGLEYIKMRFEADDVILPLHKTKNLSHFTELMFTIIPEADGPTGISNHVLTPRYSRIVVEDHRRIRIMNRSTNENVTSTFGGYNSQSAFMIGVLHGSALEHGVMNNLWGLNEGNSSVKILQRSKDSNQNPNFLIITSDNLPALQTDGTYTHNNQTGMSFHTVLWNSLKKQLTSQKFFESESISSGVILLTPGKVNSKYSELFGGLLLSPKYSRSPVRTIDRF